MQRLILLILLLTVVYSWEECKYVVVAIWSKLTRRNQTYQRNQQLDVLISDIVLIATMPLSLAYLILGSANLPTKLLIILVEFIVLGLFLQGVREYSLRRRFTAHYEGVDKISAIIFSLAGLVSPSMRFATNAVRASIRPGRLLLALAVPIAFGLVIAIAVHSLGPEEFTAILDQLLTIAVLGFILNVTIEILETIFRYHKFNLVGLTRIILGITIVFVLTKAW